MSNVYNGGGFMSRKPRTKPPKKKCPICEKEKTTALNFYKSSSPMFAADGCVPICTNCVKNYIVDEDGSINLKRFKGMLQKLDKPLYFDVLEASYGQYRTQHPNMTEAEIQKNGKDVVGLYFKNINSFKYDKDKTFIDSEREGFAHQNAKNSVTDRAKVVEKYASEGAIPIQTTAQKKWVQKALNYKPSKDDFELFGDGFSNAEYKKMHDKYEKLKMNYSLQTNLHQEALATYVRFKVKEEIATADGHVDEAKKWYEAAQNAASNGKLTPKQLTESDLQGGINSFSEIFKAVEQAVDVIPILPQFKFRPNDALDFTIWCYINYIRDLQGLPQCEYEDVYKFYDKKKQEYIEQYGDPYGIFDEDPSEKNRPNIEKFITLPKDYGNDE